MAVASCGEGSTKDTARTTTVAQQSTSGATSGTETAPTTEAVTTTGPAAGVDASDSQDSTTGADSEPDAGTTVGLSDLSLVYAEDLGGTSHKGEELYLLIGATVESEERAQTLLEEAIPLFGDMQSYFIVQNSSNFRGLEPGKWMVIEAYRDKPSQENVEFARRGFPKAQIKTGIVLTTDPIPVYEDMMGL